MTKRGMWWFVCILWAAIWGFLGMILWPFLVFAFVSLSMILIPVGVPETPRLTHDSHKWTP